MGAVIQFPVDTKPASASAGALSPAVMLEALLFECSMLVDPLSREALALYRAYTGATRVDPDAVHQWLFVEARVRVALIPALADIALRAGRINRAAHAEIMAEMADLLRQTLECA